MLLRPRLKIMVQRAVVHLNKYGNTLAVAPTGAGKTIMLSKAIMELHSQSPTPMKTAVIAHRDILTDQNINKFKTACPELSTGIFNASEKCWDGDVTFTMIQTISRARNLENMPKIDILVIDEAHHAAADSYMRVIKKVKNDNQNVKILGVTATSVRGDKKGLSEVFDNCCDQITVHELISSGHLVRPVTFIKDVADIQSDLAKLRKSANDEYDLEKVGLLMNKDVVNEAVVDFWKEKASDRQTVVFCSNIKHAKDVCNYFNDAEIPTVVIHNDMSEGDRSDALGQYNNGTARVIVNVTILTEGWDSPPTSCVILLRPTSYKSTYIQMIGRGLRTVNNEEHPGVIKTDCIVLDFGVSTHIHGSIGHEVRLDDGDINEGEARSTRPHINTQHIKCPGCSSKIPKNSEICPICGFDFLITKENLVMKEVDILKMEEDGFLKQSDIIWTKGVKKPDALLWTGFMTWIYIKKHKSLWYAVTFDGCYIKLLTQGTKIVCLAASDDWLNKTYGEKLYEIKDWKNEPASSKQVGYLSKLMKTDLQKKKLTKFDASNLITEYKNFSKIERVIKTGVVINVIEENCRRSGYGGFGSFGGISNFTKRYQ